MDDSYDSGSSLALSPRSQEVHGFRKKVQKLFLQFERQKKKEESVKSEKSESERSRERVRRVERKDRWRLKQPIQCERRKE